jgi:Zn-dependent peptidase ImmA (M78 family)
MMCRADDVAPRADRTLEREANVFEADLLMPEPAVRRRKRSQRSRAFRRVRRDDAPAPYSFGLGERPE